MRRSANISPSSRVFARVRAQEPRSRVDRGEAVRLLSLALRRGSRPSEEWTSGTEPQRDAMRGEECSKCEILVIGESDFPTVITASSQSHRCSKTLARCRHSPLSLGVRRDRRSTDVPSSSSVEVYRDYRNNRPERKNQFGTFWDRWIEMTSPSAPAGGMAERVPLHQSVGAAILHGQLSAEKGKSIFMGPIRTLARDQKACS